MLDDIALIALDLVELAIFPEAAVVGALPFWNAPGVAPELKDALQELTEQIESNPNDADARFRRGAVCQGLGRFAEAYADFSASLRLRPRNARAWLLLSECLAALRMHDQAKTARRQAFEIDPRVEG